MTRRIDELRAVRLVLDHEWNDGNDNPTIHSVWYDELLNTYQVSTDLDIYTVDAKTGDLEP